MNEQIEFNWKIHHRCNYRCPYCFNYNQWVELSKFNEYFPLDKWVKAWHKIYEKYMSVHIKIASGEPFIYPNFFELVKELSKEHTFEIITNLSCNKEKLNTFLAQINHAKITLFLSFHPLFESFDDFVEKALIVKDKSCCSGINFVAYPPDLKRIRYFKDKFEAAGFDFLPLPFRGFYKGVSYPDGYTEEERNLIYSTFNDSTQEQKNNLKEMLFPPLTKGRLCYAGQKFACVESNGIVYRCSDNRNKILGNFFDEDFKLLEKPIPCEIDVCVCEFKWLVREEDIEKNIQAPGSFISRKKIPPFKIFFTWDIHYSCNYKCTYCFFDKIWHQISIENRYPGIEKWIQVWDDVFRRYGSCHIHITGGEPTIYPDFFELVKSLSKYHTIVIDTNLSFDVQAVIDKLMSQNIGFTATFHPLHDDFNSFLKKSVQLRDNGFDILVEYVAYPPQLEKIKEYKVEFLKVNIPFKIGPFRGEFNGKTYPEAYNQQEKMLIEDYSTSESTKLQMSWFGKDQKKEKRTKKLCRMGQMYAKVRPDGEVYRCCKIKDDAKLGNMLEGTFALLNNTLPCVFEDGCNCWRAMIVGEEDTWLCHWR